jgi:hypothetical protein
VDTVDDAQRGGWKGAQEEPGVETDGFTMRRVAVEGRAGETSVCREKGI